MIFNCTLLSMISHYTCDVYSGHLHINKTEITQTANENLQTKLQISFQRFLGMRC